MAACTDSLTLARLSELLATVDASADVLRTFIKQEQAKQDQDPAAAYSAKVASSLGLPFHADPAIASQAGILRVASERLAQLVTPPRHLVFEAAGSFYTTLALQIALRSDVSSVLNKASKECGQEGVPIDVLSKKTGLDADLLGRLLRHLTVSGIFQEVAPDTFANTVASSTMVDNPEFNAHLDLVMYEGQLAAPFWPDLIKKRFAASQEKISNGVECAPPPLSAFSLYSPEKNVYAWLHSPEHADRGKNFNLAMRGMSDTEGLAFLPVDYPFSALPNNTLVVDVGGGIGSVPSLVLPSVPHLRFIVQDLETVVAQAHEAASPAMKCWIGEGKVRFSVQDFFAPQPAEAQGAVFILKNVIHNYPDSKGLEILAAIRPSKPHKLLIIDRLVVPHLRTQGSTPVAESNIYCRLRGPGGGKDAELVASSQRTPTMYDLVMGSLHGGRTRTLDEWRALLVRAGFRLDAVYPLRASTGQAVLEATIAC